jgi:hypothetical protein
MIGLKWSEHGLAKRALQVWRFVFFGYKILVV